MDVSFALITEGITDQVTLEAILKGHYKRFGDVDVEVKIVQPTRDATDASKQANDGGWERVFEACSDPDTALDALEFSNYLIVQIDTDQGDHINYGLALSVGGIDIDERTLISEARKIIAGKFGTRWTEIKDRVFTAVSVHSLECWLMALHAGPAPCVTKNCADRLNRHLQKQNVPYKKEHATYEAISKDFRKTSALEGARKRCASLDLFVASLPPP